MPNIHIVQCDDPKYLPFARSRLKQIRANGLLYAVQQFTVDGVTIQVRVEGTQEFIRISGGTTGNIWVLLMIEKTVTTPSVYAGVSSSQDITRKTRIVRISKFGNPDPVIEAAVPETKAKVVATFTGSNTKAVAAGSYSGPTGVGGVPEPTGTWYYDASITNSSDMMTCPVALSVYGGVPAYYAAYVMPQSSTTSKTYTWLTHGDGSNYFYTTTTDISYTGVSATLVKYKGLAKSHVRTTGGTSHQVVRQGAGTIESSSTTATPTGDGAYDPAALPDVGYSTVQTGQEFLGATTYVYDATALDFVVSSGPYIGFTNPSSWYSTAWTWASGPATVNTAPGDPEWDVLAGAVPRKRRRDEVGWYKQGHDFIQWGAGVSDPTWVYDRFCAPASQKTFAGGPRAYALDYNHCVHIGGVTGYPASWTNGVASHKLTLIRQIGTGDPLLENLTILGVVDLAAVDGIGADFIQAFSLSALPGAPAASSYYDNTRNTVIMHYDTGEADTYYSLKIQIAIDQKALFDPLTEWN